MIEMDEQFQKEFGYAMAQLRSVHHGLAGSATNARGEARALVASDEQAGAVTSYEISQAYWDAAERLRPVLGSFEDADRRAATLMDRVKTGAESDLGDQPVMTPEPLPGSYAEIVSSELGRAFLLSVAPDVQLRFRVIYDGGGKITTGVFADVNTDTLRRRLARARADRERVEYLEGQIARLDEALRGRPATLDEKIRETETTEDLIDAAVVAIRRGDYDTEHERAESLAAVTSGAAKLLGVTALPEILPKLRKKLGLPEVDLYALPAGTLIAGEWISAAGENRKTYVGRFVEVDTDDGAPIIEYICECGEDDSRRTHIVSTKLRTSTVRLPIAEEIVVFDAVAEATGLLRLPDASDQ